VSALYSEFVEIDNEQIRTKSEKTVEFERIYDQMAKYIEEPSQLSL
jgi:hypothetical protein